MNPFFTSFSKTVKGEIFLFWLHYIADISLIGLQNKCLLHSSFHFFFNSTALRDKVTTAVAAALSARATRAVSSFPSSPGLTSRAKSVLPLSPFSNFSPYLSARHRGGNNPRRSGGGDYWVDSATAVCLSGDTIERYAQFGPVIMPRKPEILRWAVGNLRAWSVDKREHFGNCCLIFYV